MQDKFIIANSALNWVGHSFSSGTWLEMKIFQD